MQGGRLPATLDNRGLTVPETGVCVKNAGRGRPAGRDFASPRRCGRLPRILLRRATRTEPA